MTTAIVLSIIILALASVFAFRSLASYFRSRFGENPFRVKTMLLLSASFLAVVIGLDWRASLAASHGDVLNGTLVVVTGAMVFAIVLIHNLKKFGSTFGLLASLLQGIGIPVFLVLSPAIFFAFFFKDFGVRYVRILRD